MSNDTTSASPATSDQEPRVDATGPDTAGSSPRLRNFGFGLIAASAVVVILAFVLQNSVAG